ncbi:MAG TPA: type II secretion system F family protein [Microvirga sp.]|nr:type II secretion system F family protein [Microvirga sp.]
MARFHYFAATAGNATHDGTIEAESMQDALGMLRSRGFVVIRIGKPSRLSTLRVMLNREVVLRSPLRFRELARLSQEWGGLVEAGIPVEESLALLGRACPPSTRRILLAVRDDVKAGMPLHEALGRFPGSFPPIYRALVQAGEAAGNLGSAIRRLGDDLMARRALKDDIRNALLYPLFLLVTASAGILVLMLVVVPNLETLLGEGGEERLSAVTRIVLEASRILRNHGVTLLGATAVLAVSAALFVLSPKGRVRLDAVILRMPVFGPLVRDIETGRFARTLGALLRGGVTLPVAMLIVLRAVANRHMRTAIEDAHRSIVSGAAIGDAIGASRIFRDDAIGLIRVGERTGDLAAALERTAALHEARATRQLKALAAMLTPLMTIGFGAIAGVIIYAMLSTILGINELAGR